MWLLAAYRRTHSPGRLAWSEGRRPLGAVPYSSREPGALGVALSYDDSTINIVVVIIIIIILDPAPSYFVDLSCRISMASKSSTDQSRRRRIFFRAAAVAFNVQFFDAFTNY